MNATISGVIASDEMQLALSGEEVASSFAIVSRDGYEVLAMPIDDASGRVGYFLLSYPDSVYYAQRVYMLEEVAIYRCVVRLAGHIVMLGCNFALR